MNATVLDVHPDTAPGPDLDDPDGGSEVAHWFCCDPHRALCGAVLDDDDYYEADEGDPDPDCPLCNLIRDEQVPCADAQCPLGL